MFVRAHEENCKQIELEKKRAQKEEEEKLKLNAPKKGPLHWMQTAIKSGNVKWSSVTKITFWWAAQDNIIAPWMKKP